MLEEAKEFFGRRLTEAGGALLIVSAVGVGLALASYSAHDPSFGTSTAERARNILGLLGAVFADGAIQAMGLAAFLVIAPLIVWGLRRLRHEEADEGAGGLGALAGAILGATLALGALPQPDRFDWPAGLGGLLGQLLYDGLFLRAAALTGVGAGAPARLLAAVIGVVAVIPLYLWALGFTFREAVSLVSGLRERAEGLAERLGELNLPELPRIPLPSLPSFRRRTEAPEELEPWAEDEDDTIDIPPPDDDEDLEEDERNDLEVVPVPLVPRARVKRTGPSQGPASKREAKEAEPLLDLEPGLYQLPPLSLLAKPKTFAKTGEQSDEALEQNARLLETVLADFGVRGQITEVRPGPVVALYEFEPAPGIKSSRVIGLADDIARSMSAISARVAVIPGRNVLGIELPNARRETVYLRELLASGEYERTASRLALALGKDIGGGPVVADLAAMPHLLIAGTTGSGKSVGINAMILSLLFRLPPDECKLIMVDPKMLELSVYDGIPHLLTPVVTDPKKAVVALKWVVREMEDRYRKMSKVGVRNIKGFNVRIAEAIENDEILTRTVQTGFDRETGEPVYETEEMPLETMPYIVVVVDEMADLMMVAGKDIEAAVQRLAQMARAAGIHLLTATQRPSVDVITGTIKANFPTRISFQVTSKIDSRTILGEQGAEQLLGQGDMLYMAGGGRIRRVHGPFVSDAEVEAVVAYLKTQGDPDYVPSITEEPDEDEFGLFMAEQAGSGDDLYDRAVAIVARDRKASTSYIQRKLQIGYNRAARLMEQMEDQGVVSAPNHAGKRDILVGDHSED
ncbi:MAG: DNA translocase FtsK 4TM domain-containing protein [Alphaproteobacteria bacterium]|nr:DNA translocase FtsK 4TM domain-containing protein [Alphaproteobacteria bacterium]